MQGYLASNANGSALILTLRKNDIAWQTGLDQPPFNFAQVGDTIFFVRIWDS
jgi:hypothetical protein